MWRRAGSSPENPDHSDVGDVGSMGSTVTTGLSKTGKGGGKYLENVEDCLEQRVGREVVVVGPWGRGRGPGN